MNPADSYMKRIEAFVAEYQQELEQITADGVVEADEVKEGQSAIQNLKKRLQIIKKEVALDIKEIRSVYKQRILVVRATNGDQKTQRVQELNLQQNNDALPYERIVQYIENQLIDADKTKLVFEDVLQDLRQIEVKSPDPALNNIEEQIVGVFGKWKVLVEAADEKSKHTAPHDYWRGVKDGLEIALDDLFKAFAAAAGEEVPEQRERDEVPREADKTAS